MRKLVLLVACIFLLNACSVSRYYFNQRIRPEVPDQEELVSADPVMVENEKTTFIAITQTDLQWNPAPVNSFETKQEEKEVDHLLPPVNVHTVPATAVVKVDKVVKKSPAPVATSKVGPWGIFFIVIGGIELLAFVVALLLGFTVVQALVGMLIVLGILVFLMLYTALKSW